VNKKLLLIIPLVFIVGFGTNMFIPTISENISILPNQAITKPSVSEEFFEEYKQWAQNEIEKFKQYGDKMSNENKKLKLKYGILEREYENLDAFIDEEFSKPMTTIYNQTIYWEVTDSKGNQYYWNMPIEGYENVVLAQEPVNYLSLKNPETGKTYTVRDHTKFVQANFYKIIDGVYDNSKNDRDFAYEVWYIVSQLTTYSYDIGENPRWALETLSRGGGDCEDTAILIADMLKSSKHTKDWIIKLVYFDAYNPKSPQTINHVAVSIDDGKSNYILESTAKDDPYAWKDGVLGWYFEV